MQAMENPYPMLMNQTNLTKPTAEMKSPAAKRRIKITGIVSNQIDAGFKSQSRKDISKPPFQTLLHAELNKI